MLVAHMHPTGYAVFVLTLGNQLVEGFVGKELPAETLELLHLPVCRHEVEGIAVAVRRGGRAAHRLVQFRSTVAGGDDVRFVFGTGRVVDAPCLCRIGVDTFL